MFDPKTAPTFICAGDTFTTTEGPFTITAKIEYDSIPYPEDSDNYTAEDKAAWERDEWFCGVVMHVSWNDIDLDTSHVSLWGIQANLDNDNSRVFNVANDLIPDALDEAKARLRSIKADLALIDI